MSIQSNKLSFKYKQGPALSFPDINLKTSENLLILGQSGKGKSTLLHLLAGLIKPSSGSIMIGNTIISDLKAGAIDRYRGNNIGLVFQRAHFVKSLSIKNNLLLTQKLAGAQQDIKLVESVLEQVNIAHKMNSKSNQLSIGEQQRASIARALINNPELILADEPTSALDDDNTEDVMKLLLESAKASKANLIVVTHDHRVKKHFKNELDL